MNVTLHKLGRNRRLVLRFEWLTLWPVCAVLPVKSQRRDIGLPQALWPATQARNPDPFLEGAGIVSRQSGVKKAATRAAGFPLAHGYCIRLPAITNRHDADDARQRFH